MSRKRVVSVLLYGTYGNNGFSGRISPHSVDTMEAILPMDKKNNRYSFMEKPVKQGACSLLGV